MYVFGHIICGILFLLYGNQDAFDSLPKQIVSILENYPLTCFYQIPLVAGNMLHSQRNRVNILVMVTDLVCLHSNIAKIKLT